MARISIDLPPQLPFTTELQIYLNCINEGGHLDNAKLLELVSETRERFFRSLGFCQTPANDIGIVIADAAVQYLSEAFHGETLVFEMGAHDFSKYGCDLAYRVKDKATGRDIARGKTGIVFFDYGKRKVAPVPEDFRRKVGAA